MKKITFILIALMFVFSSGAFAALIDESSSGTIVCGAGGDELEIQLSPKVFAAYSGLDRVGTRDFYIIATYHEAGSRVYATAQTLAKIYKATSTSANNLATLYGQVPNSVANAESEDQWSGALWSAE